VAPPIYSGGYGYGGYAPRPFFGGFGFFPSFYMPFPFFGGILQFFFLMAFVSVA
jgi:hypothetical protein